MIFNSSIDACSASFPRSALLSTPDTDEFCLALRIFFTGYLRLLRSLGCTYSCKTNVDADTITVKIQSNYARVPDALDFFEGGRDLLAALFPEIGLEIIDNAADCNFA